jgi:hypothetical protein
VNAHGGAKLVCTLILIAGGMVGAAGQLLGSRLLVNLCPWLLVAGILVVLGLANQTEGGRWK